MKTISGEVVSSNPISISKAAKIMSGFAAVDNGASDAVRIYLQRTSDAFNSLVQFRKDCKTPISHSIRNVSQPNMSAVKSETLADTVENPEEKKLHKRKKDRDSEASQLDPVKIAGKKSQTNEFCSIKEDVEEIDQELNGSSGKKRKMADNNERKQNDEGLGIVQSSGDVQALDAHVKSEKIEYVDAGKELDGSGVKKEKKKKRKRKEDEVLEKRSEVEDVKTEIVGEVYGLEDGKKRRQKMKTQN